MDQKQAVPTGQESETQVLRNAHETLHNDRWKERGHPYAGCKIMAHIFTGLLQDVLQPGAVVSVERIPLLMAGMKLSREANKHELDNLVDAAAYIGIVDLVRAEDIRLRSEPVPEGD